MATKNNKSVDIASLSNIIHKLGQPDTIVPGALMESLFDHEILPLVKALQHEGLVPFWSCQGTVGHLCIRPTVICLNVGGPVGVARAMKKLKVKDYWVSVVNRYRGAWPKQRNKTFIIVELPGRIDYLEYPLSYRINKIPNWVKSARGEKR